MRKEKRNSEFSQYLVEEQQEGEHSSVQYIESAQETPPPVQKGKEVVYFLCCLNLTCLKTGFFWD